MRFKRSFFMTKTKITSNRKITSLITKIKLQGISMTLYCYSIFSPNITKITKNMILLGSLTMFDNCLRSTTGWGPEFPLKKFLIKFSKIIKKVFLYCSCLWLQYSCYWQFKSHCLNSMRTSFISWLILSYLTKILFKNVKTLLNKTTWKEVIWRK